jgi:EAL domain-containing protein (putative c-di-GMP-specific phosphodiesterase class I)/GGDEF domain-containing protein
MDFSVGTDKSPLRLLILDTSQKRARRLIKRLRAENLVVLAAQFGDIREALTTLRNHPWDVLCVASDFPHRDTLPVFSKLAQFKDAAPLLGYAESMVDNASVITSLSNGARDFLALDDGERCSIILTRELQDLEQRRRLRTLEKQLVEQVQHELEDTPTTARRRPRDKVADTEERGMTSSSTDGSSNEETITSLLHEQHDPLTGLYSPSYFLAALKHALASNTAPGVSLLHMEIDGLERFRARAGTEITQMLLAEVAGLLIRFQDRHCLAAYNDDATFMISLRDRTQDEVIAVAKKLRRLIQDHDFSHLDPGLSGVTCSIGMCLNEQYSAAEAEHLISRTRYACNKAVLTGGNRICAYNKQPARQTPFAPGSWPDRISRALHDDAFTLVYQPIAAFRGTGYEYYELFLRMLDDNGGLILPDKFLVSAEDNNLMAAIDRWVISNSLARLVEHHNRHGHGNFFIKLSFDSICNPDFIPWLRGQLRQIRGISSHLTFEINAATLSLHGDECQDLLQRLRRLHCHVALEHVGTDTELLKLLPALALDYIKLDHSLIHELDAHADNIATIRDIIATAHRFGIKVIAVGVQDARTLTQLRNYDIDFVQGHFLQRPQELTYDFDAQRL